MIKEMVKDSQLMMMVLITWEILKMIKKKEMGVLILLEEIAIRDNLRMINVMDWVFKKGIMEKCMRDNLEMTFKLE